jgi:hypothetical protein
MFEKEEELRAGLLTAALALATLVNSAEYPMSEGALTNAFGRVSAACRELQDYLERDG